MTMPDLHNCPHLPDGRCNACSGRVRTITRRLEIDAGHRLMNHESKCRNVHGHRYVFEVTVGAESLDGSGRVIDFSVVKQELGDWLDEHWDHGFIYQNGDHIGEMLAEQDGMKTFKLDVAPSAENLSEFFHGIAEELLHPHGVQVINVRLHETPNCYADSRGHHG